MRFESASRILVLALAVLCLLLLAVPFATSGPDLWWNVDWVDGRKLYSIDDAYRYFAAKHAFRMESVFLWNYVLPVALLFDASLSALTNGNLLAMRLAHAAVGAATLVAIARTSLRAGCGAYLATASAVIVGSMPVYLVLSSSFYAEGLAAFLVALCFLFLVTGRHTALAVAACLLPLVRPEGAIYALFVLAWFALRRDVSRAVLVALPGLAWLAVAFGFAADAASPLDWRIELRSVLAPLDEGVTQAVSPARLPNLLWMGLALASLFLARWRRWWPLLAAPCVIIAIQLVAIARGLQGFELRYLFTTLPVVAVAWAFPVRSLLDRYRSSTGGRALIAASTAAAALFFVATHALQSDWARDAAFGRPAATARAGIDRRSAVLDPGPLRAFAARTDALVRGNPQVDAIFVSDSSLLYFSNLPALRPGIDVVLVPHNATVAAWSGGYFFGFSLRDLGHRYYRFAPRSPADASAVLVVSDAGRDPFHFPAAGVDAPGSQAAERVVANVQSGRLQAYTVAATARESVDWRIPGAPTE